jgi:hypothetical protein
MEEKGIEGAGESQRESLDELREHLTFLATFTGEDNPEERLLAIERYRVARALAERLETEGADFNHEATKTLLNRVAGQLDVEE